MLAFIDPTKRVKNLELWFCQSHRELDPLTAHFTEVYSFRRVILTDYPGNDFRIDFDDDSSNFDKKTSSLI